jgi:squalene synthase HpnC
VKFASSHYENFPVVSFLVPKELRKHIAIIYWFARTTDDLADEGDLSEQERLEALDEFRKNFSDALKNNPKTNFELALIKTIEEKKLNPDHFFNLLIAFRQDVEKKRYSTFDEILEYCRHSADPVGRLILELYDIRNDEAFYYSDKICTGLQLANFYQDLGIDYQKGRLYLPIDEMAEFNVDEKLFELKKNNLNLMQLLKYSVERTENMLYEGKGLLKFLNGRLKYEIKWTILGGIETLNKIKKLDYNVINQRPSLKKSDFIKLLIKSLVVK